MRQIVIDSDSISLFMSLFSLHFPRNGEMEREKTMDVMNNRIVDEKKTDR